MARQQLTANSVSGKFPTTFTALTKTAADPSNKNQIKLTGREVVIAFNSHATDPFTVTVTSVANPADNRTQHITGSSIPAGETRMFGPLAPEGWRQNPEGVLYFEAEDASIIFEVIQLAG